MAQVPHDIIIQPVDDSGFGDNPADPAVPDTELSPPFTPTNPVTLGGKMYKIILQNEAVNGRDAWRFVLPVAPEKLTRTTQSKMQTFAIIQGGEIALSTGKAPETLQFDVLLPLCNPYLPSSMFATEDGALAPDPAVFLQAADRSSLLSHLQDDIADRQHIWVESPDFDIYNWYFLQEYTQTYSNMYGDLMLSFQFIEYRWIKTESTRVTVTPPSQASQDAKPPDPDNPATDSPVSPNAPYTTVGGETVLGLANKAYGVDKGPAGVKNINDANKNIEVVFPAQFLTSAGNTWHTLSGGAVEIYDGFNNAWVSSASVFIDHYDFTVPNTSGYPVWPNPWTIRYWVDSDSYQYSWLGTFHDFSDTSQGIGNPTVMFPTNELDFEAAKVDAKNHVTTPPFQLSSRADIQEAKDISAGKTPAPGAPAGTGMAKPDALATYTGPLPAGWKLQIPDLPSYTTN